MPIHTRHKIAAECEAEPVCRDPSIDIVGESREDRRQDRNRKCADTADQTTKTNPNCTDVRVYNADPAKRCSVGTDKKTDQEFFHCYGKSQNSQTIQDTIHRAPKQTSRYGDVLTGINLSDNRTQGNEQKELPKRGAEENKSGDVPARGESEACAALGTCAKTDDLLRSADFDTLGDFNADLNGVATEVVKAQTTQHPECAALGTDCTKSCSEMTDRLECRKNRHQCAFVDKLVCTKSIRSKRVCRNAANQLISDKDCSGGRWTSEDTIEPCQGNVCRLPDGTKRLNAKGGTEITNAQCTKDGGKIAKEDYGTCSLDRMCTEFHDGSTAKTLATENPIHTDANGKVVTSADMYTTKTIKRKVRTTCFATKAGGGGGVECPGDEAKQGVMRIESDDGSPFNVYVSTRKTADGPFYPPTIEAKPGNAKFGTCKYIDDQTTLNLASKCCTLQLGKGSKLSNDVAAEIAKADEERYKRMAVVDKRIEAVVPKLAAKAMRLHSL